MQQLSVQQTGPSDSNNPPSSIKYLTEDTKPTTSSIIMEDGKAQVAGAGTMMRAGDDQAGQNNIINENEHEVDNGEKELERWLE